MLKIFIEKPRTFLREKSLDVSMTDISSVAVRKQTKDTKNSDRKIQNFLRKEKPRCFQDHS